MLNPTLQKEKIGTARLSIFSNILLILLKLAAGIFTGSVSIISEAIHSSMDLMASVIAFFSIRISGLPPDKKHPYGHGKFENVSGVIEAFLIFIAAGWIIYEAVHKIIQPENPQSLGIGSVVMLISAVVNFIVSRRLYKVAKRTDSVALEADALHLKTDVYTSLGVFVGLVLLWIFQQPLIDPIVAIIVALMILKESISLFIKAYTPLLDTKISDDEIKQIEEIINECITSDMGFHMLRTRKSGYTKYVDLHLEMPGDMTVKASHDICNHIEEKIIDKIGSAEVNIHTEPIE